jgi:hypothetical protein
MRAAQIATGGDMARLNCNYDCNAICMLRVNAPKMFSARVSGATNDHFNVLIPF